MPSYQQPPQSFIDDSLFLGSLSDEQLVRQVLGLVRSQGSNTDRAWLCNTPHGEGAFLTLVRQAALGETLPRQWYADFSTARINHQDICSCASTDVVANNNNQVPPGQKEGSAGRSSTRISSDLLPAALQEIPTKNRQERFRRALEVAGDHIGAVSVHQVTRLLACTTQDDQLLLSLDLQSQGLELLESKLQNTQHEKDLSELLIFGAVQMPLLCHLDESLFPKKRIPDAAKNDNIGTGDNTINTQEALMAKGKEAAIFCKINTSRFDETKTLTCSVLSSNTDAFALTTRIIQASCLGRLGTQSGAKHGCLLCIPSSNNDKVGEIIGQGWNHNAYYATIKKKKHGAFSKSANPGGKNKRVIHAEVHAITDALKKHGEELCFNELFPAATAVIVELNDDCYGYDNAPPCQKCAQTLRAVGITKACHTTTHGRIQHVDLGLPNNELLNRDPVRIPFQMCCDELGVTCHRLALHQV